MDFSAKWKWLSEPNNQKTLAWLGGATVAIISSVWLGYQSLISTPNSTQETKKPSTTSTEESRPKPQPSDQEQTVTTGDITGGTVIINQAQE